MLCRVESPTTIELQVAVAAGYPVTETLSVAVDGGPVALTEFTGPVGTRTHVGRAPAGTLEIRYEAEVHGEAPEYTAEPMDELAYTRPSRYAEADRLAAFAQAEFSGVHGAEQLVAAVSSWVGRRLNYVPEASSPTDGAAATLLAGAGVCRDYAHLVVALLRARDVPARLVAVYAPGLSPMDFHAVAEALVDGRWRVVDATLLAPRASLVRISTGRDAADTAFLTNRGGRLVLDELEVSAIVDGELPTDDVGALASIR